MIYKTINLKDFYKDLKYDVNLDVFCPINLDEVDLKRKRPAIIIFPGGGYNYTSDREGEIIALRFLGYDMATFVLKYSCNPKCVLPYPQIEGYAAIDYVRKHAEELNINPNKIFVMGFSAGGHLAATLCAYEKNQFVGNDFKDITDTKINGCILGYPVITMEEMNTNLGTRVNLVRDNPEKLIDLFSIEKHIKNHFPRTFIFACQEDPWVPIINSELLVNELKKNNVEVEFHVYHAPIHGSSLGDRTVYADNIDISNLKESTEWPLKAIDFINKNC